MLTCPYSISIFAVDRSSVLSLADGRFVLGRFSQGMLSLGVYVVLLRLKLC